MPKVSQIPNIDLGGSVRVIDESGDKPVWRTLERCYATRANAIRILKKHKQACGWLFDDMGNREFITV